MVVLYGAVGMAVFVAEPVERDGDFVFGELVLLTRQHGQSSVFEGYDTPKNEAQQDERSHTRSATIS